MIVHCFLRKNHFGMTSIQRLDRGRNITGAERCDAEGKTMDKQEAVEIPEVPECTWSR